MMISPEIKSEYARARKTALDACEEYRRAVYGAVPRLEEIVLKRRELLFSLGLQLREADDKDAVTKRVMEAVAALNAEEKELFGRHRISKELLQPQFRCKACEDTGFVGITTRRMCKCLKQKLLRQQYASSHILDDESFETFDLDIFKSEKQKKLMGTVRLEAMEYADQFPNNEKKDILIMGNAGLGKTFLLNCIAKRVFDRGYGVLKLTAYNLINNVLKNLGGEPFDFVRPDLLIIDDLGTEPMIPNITREHLFATVNERQSAEKSTVIATNFMLEELQDVYGERLFSRFVAPRHTRVIRLNGENVRINAKQRDN